MIIDTLVINRTQADVDRFKSLMAIGWASMTADEKTEYLASHGDYKASDINRVSEAEDYLADEFNDFIDDLAVGYADAVDAVMASLQYDAKYYDMEDPVIPASFGQTGYDTVVISPVKTDWTTANIQKGVTDISYYLANIATLRNVIPVTAPNAPSALDGLSFDGANAIEQILIAAHNALTALISRKNSALQGAEAEKIEKYRRQSLSWLQCGEIASGEA